MLSIQSTDLLTGACIRGDYWDFDELITSIYRIVGEQDRYFDYQGSRNRILNVCRILRQATKGENEIEYVANGIHKGIQVKKKTMIPEKNIYFSANVLWPELVFMSTALNDFIRLHEELIETTFWNPAITTVQHFQALIAQNLRELMGEEDFAVLIQVITQRIPTYFRYVAQYIDVLNLEYLTLSKQEREEHFSAYAIRPLVEGEDYQTLKEQILQVAGVTKQELHMIETTLTYPEWIDW